MRDFRAMWGVVAGAGVLALGAGYLGALHPAGDSLAVFRPQIALLLCALAGLGLVLGRWRRAGLLAAVALLAGASSWQILGAPGSAGAAAPGYTVYQKNLLYRAFDPSAVLADITAVAPDFLTLQEVSPENRAVVYEGLPPDYARAICPFARVGAVAVAARFETVEGGTLCVEGLGVVGLRVETPLGRLWLVSVHLHWPWPHGQPEQAARIAEILEGLEGPVLIGGDFNMVPWSATLRRIARATGTRVLGPHHQSFRLRGIGLPIDHVLAPMPGTTETRPGLGSDHLGIVARLAPVIP